MPFYLKRWPQQGNVRRLFQVKWVAFGPSEMFESWADPLAMTEAGGKGRVGGALWDRLTWYFPCQRIGGCRLGLLGLSEFRVFVDLQKTWGSTTGWVFCMQ